MAVDRGLVSLLRRAIDLDASATCKLIPVPGEDATTCWVTTPFGTLASRRTAGTATGVAPAEVLLRRIQSCAGIDGQGRLKPDVTADTLGFFPGATPAATGFTELERIPATEVRQLVDQAKTLTRQFAGPLGPPASLLAQNVITITGADGQEHGIPMRLLITLTSFGFVAPQTPVRVARAGSWLRLDALYGSVAWQRPLQLGVV